MFGKLPDLFDKNFAIGYFLPITAFLVISLFLLNEFDLLSKVISLNQPAQIDKLINITIVGLLSWTISILLLGANREILRLMEGYGRFNPTRIFAVIEKRRYYRLQEEKSQLDEKYKKLRDSGNDIPLELINKRNKILRALAERFPDDERWLLPTSFGNIIRAFEVYPRVMYGLDSIPGWNRLIALIPKDYNSIVNDAKSIVDFWVNIWLLSWIIVFEYVALAVYKKEAHIIWFPITVVGISFFAFSRAKVAAFEWGELVKASFDVFLPMLYEKLGFPFPKNREEEKNLWRDLSQAMIYRIPKKIPKRDKKTSSMPEKED